MLGIRGTFNAFGTVTVTQTFSSHSDTKFSNACVLANSCLFLSNKDYKDIKGKVIYWLNKYVIVIIARNKWKPIIMP